MLHCGSACCLMMRYWINGASVEWESRIKYVVAVYKRASPHELFFRHLLRLPLS